MINLSSRIDSFKNGHQSELFMLLWKNYIKNNNRVELLNLFGSNTQYWDIFDLTFTLRDVK